MSGVCYLGITISAIALVTAMPAYFMSVFYAIWNALPISHSYSSYVFAMKVPSLIFDLLTALLIYRILTKTDLSKSRIHWTLAAWLLNPLTFIARGFNFMEVVPAFLLLLSSFLAAQKRLLSVLWLQTNLQPQITGAFTALLLFIAAMSLTQGDVQGMLQPLKRIGSGSGMEFARENRLNLRGLDRGPLK